MEKISVEYFEEKNYTEMGRSPRDRGVFLEHHQPKDQAFAYHFHPSIEVNFLQGCDMTYSFSGREVLLQRGRLCVFWAAHPHRVIHVRDIGVITNAYVSLSEFLHWPLPSDYVSLLLSGAVLCSRGNTLGDDEMARRWAQEVDNTQLKWQRLHALEIQARLFRMSVDGWDVLLESRNGASKNILGGKAILQFERMLRFVAKHYANPIKINDVAERGGVSPNYAISLFRKMLGRTIKEHITDMRMFHAKMQLSETETKILTIAMDSGFGSLSAFYEAFHNHTGVSPAAFRKSAGRTVGQLDEVETGTEDQRRRLTPAPKAH